MSALRSRVLRTSIARRNKRSNSHASRRIALGLTSSALATVTHVWPCRAISQLLFSIIIGNVPYVEDCSNRGIVTHSPQSFHGAASATDKQAHIRRDSAPGASAQDPA